MLRPSIYYDRFPDNIFEDFFDDVFAPSAQSAQNAKRSGMMSTDVRELPDAYQVEAELPGFAKGDVTIELDNGYMTIAATHTDSTEEKDEGGRYIRRERYSGSYQRSFYVGEDITEDDIKAKFADGILTVTVPKVEAKKQVEQKKYVSIEG